MNANAQFVNNLRACLGMEYLYGKTPEAPWMPTFYETGHVQPRNPGGAVLPRHAEDGAIKKFKWKWLRERP